MSDEARYLGWIRDSLARAQKPVAANPDGVLEDGLLRDAIMWRLETIGEATSHLTAELKARHSDIPWRDIAGFRNLAAHGHLVIRSERLGQILRKDLESLRALLEEELTGR